MTTVGGIGQNKGVDAVGDGPRGLPAKAIDKLTDNPLDRTHESLGSRPADRKAERTGTSAEDSRPDNGRSTPGYTRYGDSPRSVGAERAPDPPAASGGEQGARAGAHSVLNEITDLAMETVRSVQNRDPEQASQLRADLAGIDLDGVDRNARADGMLRDIVGHLDSMLGDLQKGADDLNSEDSIQELVTRLQDLVISMGSTQGAGGPA